ncbi:MAG: hypothetical protein WAK17_05500 [Candidatus Nitrosopolaris sp.]
MKSREYIKKYYGYGLGKQINAKTSISIIKMEEAAIEIWLPEFLKRAAEIANGDINKSTSVDQIWRDLGIRGYPVSDAKEIVGRLRRAGYLKAGNNKDEIRITYDGIYSTAERYGIPPTSLGVLPKDDLNRYIPRFLDILYEETRRDPSKSVDINQLVKGQLEGIGKPAISQIIEILRARGIVDVGSNADEVKMTRPITRKTFDAPDRLHF